MRPWRVSAWELKQGFKYRVHIPTRSEYTDCAGNGETVFHLKVSEDGSTVPVKSVSKLYTGAVNTDRLINGWLGNPINSQSGRVHHQSA